MHEHSEGDSTIWRGGEGLARLILESTGEAIFGIDTEGRCTFSNPACARVLGFERPDDLIGRNIHDLIQHSRADGSKRAEHESRIGRASREGLGTSVDDEVFWRADGTWFPVEYRAHPVRRGTEVVGTVVTFTDLTRRKQDEATIAEQIRLARFGRDVGLALTREGTLEEALGRCAGTTVRHLNAAFARIWTIDEAGETLELRASAGLYTHTDGPHGRVPVGLYKIGQIARDRTPHLTNAVIGDPRVSDQVWAEREKMVAFAGYPLIVEERLVGVLAIFARQELSDATLRAMASVADEIAIGIERKRAEERLHRQREWLRVTLACIGDAVIATDLDGQVTFLNGVAETLTGWPQREAKGLPLDRVFRIVNESSRETVESPVHRALKEGRVVGLANHTILIARDGTELAIDDSAAPIRDEDGQVTGAVLIFRDVTERKRAENELREQERLFHSLAESVPQLVWMAMPDGHIDWYNRRWYEYTGTTPEEMEGWGWRSVHDPGVLPDVLERWRASISTGEPFDMIFPLKGSDGEFRPFLTRVLPVRGGDGQIWRWFGTNTEISDRVRFEEELRAAKMEAESANQAKTQFLAVLSHELRTPLNPILLAASSLLEQPVDPKELRPTLQMIRQNVLLQARLIDDLLDVMRIVRGKMPLHWEVADCHKLIDQAIQICTSEVLGHHLRLNFQGNARIRHVNADPARLQQVFWNLIRNAVKFTPEGGSVTVTTGNVDDPSAPGGLIAVEVTDTGIGIEPTVLPVIFDPFQQGETTITRRFGGLGLGLAICKGIVDAHGGSIVAESQGRGTGTTFRVTLKALAEATEEADRPDRATERQSEGAGRSLRILAVEDEPTTLKLMARLLRGLGHDVTPASSVAAAVDAYEGGSYDLIISDIGLPDGTGLDLMKRVVTLRGPVAAIALTGYGMEEDIRRSRHAGFTAHLTKPIDFAKLEAMIRQVTQSSS